MTLHSDASPSRNLVPLTDSTFGSLDVVKNSLGQNTPVHDYEILYEVTESSEFGDIILADDDKMRRSRPLATFSHKDVVENRVAFKIGSEIRKQEVLMIALKVRNTVTRQEQTMKVQITADPVNFFVPQVQMKERIVVTGRETEVTLTSNLLSISSSQVKANHVECRVEAPVGSGGGFFYENHLKTTKFTLSELLKGRLVYVNTNNERYWDNVVLVVKAAENQTRVLLQIMVNPSDDQEPRRVRESQLSPFLLLIGHDWKVLSPRHMFHTDPDSPLGAITYRLRDLSGENIQFRKWNPGFGRFVKDVTRWTQLELIYGRVQVRNQKISFNSTKMLTLRLEVSDGSINGNDVTYSLKVKLKLLDLVPPRVYPGAQLSMQIDDYKPTAITKRMLRYVDEGALSSDEIKYKVTTRAYDKNHLNPLKVGQLCLFEGNSKRVKECNVEKFTQENVNDLQVMYIPPDSERGIVFRFLEFVFSVSDTAGNTLMNQYFCINLQPIINSPPRVYIDYFRLQANTTTYLTSENFGVIDPEDVSPKLLVFTIREFPREVKLYRNGVEMTSSTNKVFTAADISKKMISMYVGNQGSFNDSFQAILSDGVNLIPITTLISITDFSEYTVTSSVVSDEAVISIYVRQGTAHTLTMVSELWRVRFSIFGHPKVKNVTKTK